MSSFPCASATHHDFSVHFTTLSVSGTSLHLMLKCRCWWPRGLRRRSVTACLLGLWVLPSMVCTVSVVAKPPGRSATGKKKVKTND